MSVQAYRAALFHLLGDPVHAGEGAWQYFSDGALVVEAGRVARAGAWAQIAPTLAPDATVERFTRGLIVPGLIDAHVHFPQHDLIGAPGAHLMDWLDGYAFPAEARFADPAFARAQAGVFLDALLAHGTTSALVFASVHACSVEALFEAALTRNLRLIAGKVLMDQNAPPALCDTAESAYTDSKALIEAWHGRGRLAYAVSPRFALTSSRAQLAVAGRLLAENPGIYLHTHLSENQAELAVVRQAFPEAADYLGVYEAHGLVGERSVFAHGVHLGESEWARLARVGAALAFCPSSNLFLGSGLFDLGAAERHGVGVGLASDVGAGTSLSLLEAMEDAYKVLRQRGRALDPFKAFYLATLGAARALRLDAHVGNFAPGKEADFLVLDLEATPMLARRLARSTSIADTLFALMILGDDRTVARTYIAGALGHTRQNKAGARAIAGVNGI